MKNAEFRHALERELLTLNRNKNPMNNTDFIRYRALLMHLHEMNVERTIEQSGIYAAAYGDPYQVVSEFLSSVRPFIAKCRKAVKSDDVRDTRTTVLFSPHLTEIALGCLMRIFLAYSSHICITLSDVPDYVIISAQAKRARISKSELGCIQHIAQLHGGRSICEYSRDYTRISISLPHSPQFQPLKFIPCHAELCRICRI